MSLVIFFGIALLIFLMGCLVIGVTAYQWYKQRGQKSASTKNS